MTSPEGPAKGPSVAPSLEEARVRLAVAETDAAKALAEAARIGWLVVNDRASSPFTDASLRAMAERLQVLRHAVHDLERVFLSLRELATPPGERRPSGEVPLPPPPERPDECGCCGRTGTLFLARVCTFCSGLGAPNRPASRGAISPRASTSATRFVRG